jgi:hypothetical protein
MSFRKKVKTRTTYFYVRVRPLLGSHAILLKSHWPHVAVQSGVWSQPGCRTIKQCLGTPPKTVGQIILATVERLVHSILVVVAKQATVIRSECDGNVESQRQQKHKTTHSAPKEKQIFVAVSVSMNGKKNKGEKNTHNHQKE